MIPSKLKAYFKDESFRFCDTGTVTTLERLNFAAEFYNEFVYNNDDIIRNFTFYFLPVFNSKNAKSLESELITKYIPRCNSTRNNISLQNIKITDVIHEIMKNYRGK